MESDLSGLDFSVLLIYFVTNQDDWNVVADSGQVLIPFGNIFISNSGCDIKHKNSSIGTDVVSFSEASKFLLPSSIPERELNGTVVSVEGDRADFNTLGGDVFLFEFTGDVSFYESCFSNTTISDEDDLELGYDLRSLHGLMKIEILL